ncbi:MAG: uracil phosphoribosyltransferase [Bacteroidetes bacterium B1(2017)]|nr:MAG: uracil phosphoribosyltransferase [Bacteroidetes bacterium B1(2017)]
MLQILTQQSSIINDFLAELRDVSIQKDRARFRKNVERIGEIMAYEVSKYLDRTEVSVQTPLGQHASMLQKEQPVLATVLRAGLALHHGFLNYFDHADNAYVSAYRKHTNLHEFEIVVEYLATPSIEGRTLILIDPMLATGRSMFLTYKALLTKGKPSRVFVVSLIASEQGVEYIQKHMPNADIFIAAVDPSLDENSYIVPGLGDAGDLCFGEKL